MKFNNPQGKFIKGRLPKPEDNFYEDRYYSTVENVFIRFDPHDDYIRVIFPSVSECVLKFTYEKLEELAAKEPTLLEIVRSAYNVIDAIDQPQIGYAIFSDDPYIFVKFDKRFR